MKVIIDISEEEYQSILSYVQVYNSHYDDMIRNGKPYEERPQGEWLFTEIDENYHVYGQCSICKERNRIGKACRSCGASMKCGADMEGGAE